MRRHPVDEPSLAETIAAVQVRWTRQRDYGEMSAQTFSKFTLLLTRFEHYATHCGATTLIDVSPALIEDFVNAHGHDRRGTIGRPAAATSHVRRSVLRMMFRTARELGLATTDPTLDVTLPPRTRGGARPLTEDEAIAIRCAADFIERPTRHAAAAALALAGGHSGEIGHLTVGDVDTMRRRVWMHGSSKTDPRWCPLDTWGLRVLAARIAHISANSADPRAMPLAVSTRAGRDEQIQARVCVALTDLLKAIGLGARREIKPASVTAYAGAAEFARTGRVEDVALRLGLRSLDRAASVIQYRWSTSTTGHSNA